MATLVTSAKLSARLVTRQTTRHAPRRGFRRSTRSSAASNLTMPALSPTMIEGNIAAWRVQPGASFSAGDVLLEIETDKATMDVEAQDDGVMVKVMQEEGAKGVKVGTRIAVLAESGDDVDSVEIPAEDGDRAGAQAAKTSRPSPQETTESGIDPTESSPSAAEAPPSSRPEADAEAGGASDTARASQSKPSPSSDSHSSRAPKTPYPLYPSVAHLLHQNGLSASDAANITPSGPNGRLLKGDVLAYLGQITKDYPATQSQRMQRLAHLDLSNITLAPPPTREPAQTAPAPAAKAAELPQETELAVPVSLTAVLATQARVREALGIELPLSTFIARATELANTNLPLVAKRTPSADELFDAVLGLDKLSPSPKSSQGKYVPRVTALGLPPTAWRAASRRSDVLDELLGSKRAAKASKPVSAALGTSESVMSVTARAGEEKRVAAFLGKMKTVLEAEPGRLVL
ncbi:pyridoxine biosynthesis protein [Teratosphaeriaceae sp. CCFEE 6253]|nr:pyridoxine biosynthesis protein [Teratosphaeriaceae sp. CCFEE 6253]